MPIYLRQSTASQEVTLGPFVDSTDGNTEETGLTIANTDILIHKAGGTTLPTKTSGGATHISNGIYYAVLDATDTNTIGPLVIYCHPSGALATRVECVVLDEAVYDVLFGTTAPSTYAGADTSGTTTLLSRLGTPSDLGGGATISANLSDIEAQTDDIGAAGAGLTALATQASVNTIDDFLDTEIAAIKAVTDQITFGTANRVNAQVYGVETGAITAGAIATDAIGAAELAADAVSEIAAAISIPSAATIADAVWDEDATAHQTQGTFGQAIGDPVADSKTIYAAVVTDASGASVGVDTTAILEDTGTTLQAELDGIQADTEDIQSRIPAALTGAGNIKADVLAISGDTTAADTLEAALDGTITATVNDAAATTTSFVTTLSSSVNDFYNGRILTFTSGALAGQQTEITDYVGATLTVTVVALTAAPANGVSFVVT